MRKIAFIVTAVAIVQSMACDPGCPNLALMAVVWESGNLDSNLITVSASRDGDSILNEAPIQDLYSLASGMYDLSFSYDGESIGGLSQVCTVGFLTGCDAEEANTNDTPRIVITDGDPPTVSLESNGTCP